MNMTTAELSPPDPEAPHEALPAADQARLVVYDLRRPWPLGLPPADAVLEAIVARAEVEEPLQASHLRVLSLLPEHLYDAARTSLAGTPDPVGLATASAWRTLIALDVSSSAAGADQAALQALIDEAVDAREKLLAAGYFALDGGASADELMTALGDAVEQLTEKARFRARPKPRHEGVRARLLSIGVSLPAAGTSRTIVLGWACVGTLLFTASVHLYNFATEPTPTPWVVVGDVDRGHAYLAPGSPAADEASLRATIATLGSRGLEVIRSASGEWVVQRTGVAR